MSKHPPLFIVDYPLDAQSYRQFFQEHGIDAHVLSLQPPQDLSLPTQAFLLVGVELPHETCGLLWAHEIRERYPNVQIIYWAHDPAPFLLWAGYREGTRAFLDKSGTPSSLIKMIKGILISQDTWPSLLYDRAVQWDREVGFRLSGLSRSHWEIWEGLLRGEDVGALSERLRLSEGTVRRKRRELYEVVGVRGWAEAVRMACEWGLTTVKRGRLAFRLAVREMFGGEEGGRTAMERTDKV